MSSKRFNNDPPLGTRPLKSRSRSEEIPASSTEEARQNTTISADASGNENKKHKVNLSKEAYASSSTQNTGQDSTNSSVDASSVAGKTENTTSSDISGGESTANSNAFKKPADSSTNRTSGNAPTPKKKKTWGWIGAGAAAIAVGAVALTGPFSVDQSVANTVASQPPAQTISAVSSQSRLPETESVTESDSKAVSLDLNAEHTLIDMTYRYNSKWVNQVDPIDSGSSNLYELDLGTDGTVLLSFHASGDHDIGVALAQLREMNAEERPEAIDAIFNSFAANLENGTAELAPVPPQGTLAMWSFSDNTTMPDESAGKMRGYAYLGIGYMYTVFEAANNEETLDTFDPTWKQIINSIRFSGTIPSPAQENMSSVEPLMNAPVTPVESIGIFDDNGFIFADSSERYLTEDDIAGLSLEQLGFARNEIYARNGNEFETAKYIDFYNQYDWYRNIPNKEHDIPLERLNAVEQANIWLIKAREATLS